MMVDLLLFSVENNVFPSKADHDDVTTMRCRPKLSRGDPMFPEVTCRDGIPIGWGEQLVMGSTSMKGNRPVWWTFLSRLTTLEDGYAARRTMVTCHSCFLKSIEETARRSSGVIRSYGLNKPQTVISTVNCEHSAKGLNNPNMAKQR